MSEDPANLAAKKVNTSAARAGETGRQHGASAGAGATAGVVSTASWADLAGACRVSRARRTSRPLVRPRSAYCRTRATGGSRVARQAAGSLRTHSPAGRLTRPGSSPAVLQQAASPEPRPSATPNPNPNRLIADSFRQQVRYGRCRRRQPVGGAEVAGVDDGGRPCRGPRRGQPEPQAGGRGSSREQQGRLDHGRGSEQATEG